ncbi:SDR family oxidoreductase [Thalassospira sp.]|uniref:UDP-glucose 4-epimerase family protein n=1 Tax=Thalassospira sp. TaxID=1912094 RepID=UPI000C4C3FF1|nr:SDR family oxidoreductase [Thalassospira sp.]MBC05981.1 nucleoside-diphosphate sugar epimerase [Thalassospira sp.]
MKILLTGATGFLGSRLANVLVNCVDVDLTAAVRRSVAGLPGRSAKVDALDGDTDWRAVLSGQQIVIHAAARAHVMKDSAPDPLAEYRRINVDGTLNLARQAAEAGVKRFVFISSIKVNGEETPKGHPFSADSIPDPQDDYGISKWEAEQGLAQIASETGMEFVVIRPTLVYGPSVKGNFAKLITLLDKGFPLPFGAIHNQRSLVALDNLIDLIMTCADHPKAKNQVFLASDGADVSTTTLLRELASTMGKSARLVPVPESWLMFGAKLLGKEAVAQRVLGSLQVDISKAQDLLGWQPPLTVREGLSRCFEPK